MYSYTHVLHLRCLLCLSPIQKNGRRYIFTSIKALTIFWAFLHPECVCVWGCILGPAMRTYGTASHPDITFSRPPPPLSAFGLIYNESSEARTHVSECHLALRWNFAPRFSRNKFRMTLLVHWLLSHKNDNFCSFHFGRKLLIVDDRERFFIRTQESFS